jgi:co-chaperonin GroES (HSP10)
MTTGRVQYFGEVVAVAREKSVEKTKSGLIIVEQAQRKQQFAAVVGFGDDSIFGQGGAKDGKLAIGDAVYIPAVGGVLLEQKIGGRKYVVEMLHDDDIKMSYPGDPNVELEDDGSLTTGEKLIG